MSIAGVPFALRTLIMTVLGVFAVWSAGAHTGWLISPGSLHSPIVVYVLAMVALLSVGPPLYSAAYHALLQNKIDASVIVVFLTSFLATGSVFLDIFEPSLGLGEWGFVLAIILLTSWFLARAGSLFVFPRLQRKLERKRSPAVATPHARAAGVSAAAAIPLLAGLLAAFAMVGIYLGILSLLQSPTHAFEQLLTDGLWVGLVAFGFGAQIGLYTFLRLTIRAAQAAGATAVTGAGTGTSTLGMLACCAHHLSDVAPLVAMTGASGLSGAVGFFTEWKYVFIALGIGMNAIGILVTLRTIRRCRAHQSVMAVSTETPAALACH